MTRVWGQRGILVAAALALAALGGCGPSGPPKNAGLTLHRGNGAEPDSLDPQKISAEYENNIVSEMLEGLMTVDANAAPTYGAAQSYQTSADGLVWTFKLRDETWSDGVPVTAGDFVFSFRRILDPKTAAKYASLLYPIKNAQAVNEGRLPPDAVGVKALDAKTVEITLEQPTPYFLALLTHMSAEPVPQHVVEKFGDGWTKPGVMVSNGPYVLAEWVPNSHITLVKNARYYDAPDVEVQSVVYYPITDESVELKRFRAGELDMTNSLPSRTLADAKSALGDQLHRHSILASRYLLINIHRKPFDDPRVRRALSLAIDREAIANQILGSGEIPAYGFVPPGIANYAGAELDFKPVPVEKRRAEARALLASAGFGPGHPLHFTLRYRDSLDIRRVAVAIQDLFKQIGVEAELLNSESRVQLNALRTQDFDVAEALWFADYNDAENFLFLFQSTTGQMNYTKYANPAYDALLEKAAHTMDLRARADILHQAEEILLADAPLIPLYFESYRRLVAPSVKGYADNALKWNRTRYMRIEK